MEYGIPRPGSQLLHDEVTYDTCETYEEVVNTVFLGDLLDVSDHFEVWMFSGRVAVIPNEVGILE